MTVVAANASSDSYVFRDGDITWMYGRGMAASALDKIKAENGSEFVWAQRSDRIFVGHDAALIADARKAIAPRLSREEQEHRLARVVDAAIQRGTMK